MLLFENSPGARLVFVASEFEHASCAGGESGEAEMKRSYCRIFRRRPCERRMAVPATPRDAERRRETPRDAES